MKYLYADSLDFVDPRYDFLSDRFSPGRRPYWDDVYAHELLPAPPYDGMLVSRGTVGDHLFRGKYTAAQAMRFRREGARKFLRLDAPRFADQMLMGDCGAFSYAQMDRPPYVPEDMIDFYVEGQFTHACAIDHIIFEFDPGNSPRGEVRPEIAARYDLTLEYAGQFLAASQKARAPYTPIGVVQGWSPDSMARAAARLEKMGYDYLALGGMVPLNAAQIRQCLAAVRSAVSPSTRLHLLGFAKAEQIHEFTGYGITSFDSTSPLLRAFKDATHNYYLPLPGGGLAYYSALRVPRALENRTLVYGVRNGKFNPEQLSALERRALDTLRRYDRHEAGMDETLGALMAYNRFLVWKDTRTAAQNERALDELRAQMARTLADRPWRACACGICSDVSIEVMIFRSTNHNKRRGFHNLAAYYSHLQRTIGTSHADLPLHRHPGPAEQSPRGSNLQRVPV